MRYERAPFLSYANLPIVYLIDLGDEDTLWFEKDGKLEPVESLFELPNEVWRDVHMFGPSLGLLVPCYADILNARGDTVGGMNIAIRDGRPSCVGIYSLPEEQLTGALLRSLPIAGLVREAVVSQTVRVLRSPEGLFGARYVESDAGFGHLQSDLRQELAAVDEKARRRVIDDAFLERVATIYREAVSQGNPPANAIVEALGPTTPTNARRWVTIARREGFLGPALASGRVGELHEESVSS